MSASIDDIEVIVLFYVYFMSNVGEMKTISVCIKRHVCPYQSSDLLHYAVVVKDT